jgi:hypothetical protein
MNFSSLKQNPNLICQIATSIGHMESNLTMHLVFLLESINTPWILPKCQHFEIFIMNTEMALKKKNMAQYPIVYLNSTITAVHGGFILIHFHDQIDIMNKIISC